ncbi:lipopolysaccharide core heptose(I) kinase RfaP [Erwinia sp. CPCC 100877]|nr:lipopolysaccharide core heptose(I) kinase RfaP [Erwinia sp. CPCC 100877]
MVELKAPFDALWQGKDAFAEASRLQGEVFRELESRRTIRFEVNNASYFLKWHHGTSLKEVVKNLISLRLPVLGADREWNAIHRLKALGVDTMKGVAFGQKGLNPLRRTSFIITEDLSPAISLEDYCADWVAHPPVLAIKRMLIRRLATIVREMHLGGVNHRDCYLCHFLLHQPFNGTEQNLKLSVIDLHRAQIRRQVPRRWRDKDLIGLYFSSLEIGLTTRDVYHFLKIYFKQPLHNILKNESRLFLTARRKAEKIRERTIRKSL